MNIKFKVITTLMLSAAFLSGNQLSASAAEQKTHAELFEQAEDSLKVVCLGDSVTGVYYHTGGRRAYTDMVQIGLQRLYPHIKIEAVNSGISGHTTVKGLERFKRDVLDHHPDIVTIMFSLNDATGLPLDQFEANLMNMINQSRNAGIEVVLCTPNSVFETKERPIARLEQYVAIIRKLAEQEKLPLADCYAAYEKLHQQDEWAWTMLMSDDIHPNMRGHKLLAETIINTLCGKTVSFTDVPAPLPTLPYTISLLKAGKPVKLLAMPPYDEIASNVIRESFPDAKLDVQIWDTTGMTLQEIEKSADQVRPLKPDWVIVALPRTALPAQDAKEVRSLSWVLNKSLSFGYQEWDCLIVSPDVSSTAMTSEETLREEIFHQFVAGQDLTLLSRSSVTEQKQTEPNALFRQWWMAELEHLN
ncbi:MAG: GDSL-type esterase/lipase family protein [Planctomycetaceae bacterium]